MKKILTLDLKLNKIQLLCILYMPLFNSLSSSYYTYSLKKKKDITVIKIYCEVQFNLNSCTFYNLTMLYCCLPEQKNVSSAKSFSWIGGD